MRQIKEFRLSQGKNVVAFPNGGRVLSVAGDGSHIRLIVLWDIEAEHNEDRVFSVVQTGQAVSGEYIGTIMDGSAAQHVFDETPEVADEVATSISNLVKRAKE